ncbi:telomere binding protein [Microbotryomycetes sp. JL221]|nr:telomere binding protein [Microbotryomycetes sp. JL221]
MSIDDAPVHEALNNRVDSLDTLRNLLYTPLYRLGLLSDQPKSLLDSYGIAEHGKGPLDSNKFFKRQLALVQRVIVERVWPDWSTALDDHDKSLLTRWFCPPSEIANSEDDVVGHVAISAWSVLATTLSTSDKLQRSNQTLEGGHDHKRRLTRESVELSFNMLMTLSNRFSLNGAYSTIFRAPLADSGKGKGKTTDTIIEYEQWQQFVKTMVSIPTRAANAWGVLQEASGLTGGNLMRDMPKELELDMFVESMTGSLVDLAWRLSAEASSESASAVLSLPLTQIVSSRTFLNRFLPLVIPRLVPSTVFPTPVNDLVRRRRFAQLWQEAIAELSDRQVRRLLRDALNALQLRVQAASASNSTRARIRGASFLLSQLFGSLVEDEDLQANLLAVVLEEGNAYDGEKGNLARIVTQWAVMSGANAIEALFQSVSSAWSSVDNIKRAGRPSRTSLPMRHEAVVDFSQSRPFLDAVSAHLSLVDPSLRLLGMLMAEVMSQRSHASGSEVNPLSFGEEMWTGQDDGHLVARKLRSLVDDPLGTPGDTSWREWLLSAWKQPATPVTATQIAQLTRKLDQPAQIGLDSRPKIKPLISVIGDEDDPDDLPSYPLPAQPHNSHLSTLASDDPSLYASALPNTTASSTRKRGKLRPPVYVPELTAYLRGLDPEGKKEEADGEAERVEVGLNEGEGLIRRKAGWGGEVEENAVDLTITVLTMHDQFEIDGFEERKAGLLIALVACAPTKAPPTIIEQFFQNNYSISQRHSMLSALALGARELAGLPLPPAIAQSHHSSSNGDFPSQRLPEAIHRKLVGNNQSSDAIDRLSADLTRVALSNARSEAETSIPEGAREKIVRVRRFRTSSDTSGAHSNIPKHSIQRQSFIAIAAEYFIMPLVNRFWLCLQNATSDFAGLSQSPYVSSRVNAVPTLLDPLVLSKFLSTLSILVHASRHAPQFLSVIAPQILKLAIGLKPLMTPSSQQGGDDIDTAVIAAAMELLLSVFDAVTDLDHGSSLVNSSAIDGEGGVELVVQIKEWAEKVFELDEHRHAGTLTSANGSAAVLGRSGRACAGLLLRIDECLQKWRGRVGWN